MNLVRIDKPLMQPSISLDGHPISVKSVVVRPVKLSKSNVLWTLVLVLIFFPLMRLGCLSSFGFLSNERHLSPSRKPSLEESVETSQPDRHFCKCRSLNI